MLYYVCSNEINDIDQDKRLVTRMRKLILSLCLLACMLLPIAALADGFTFAEQGAVCALDGKKYTILTPDNLPGKAAWLSSKGLTVEETAADFQARGVLLQAWNTAGDVCIEISAVQDSYGMQYFDINKVTNDERKNYRTSHASDKTGEWREQGYDYKSDAEWQNYKDIGRFLKLEYTRSINGTSYRGYARKTIRNGWHIHIDYQVYGRGLKSSDSSALEALMKTWEFLEIIPRPATSATKLIFTATPPSETNTGKFSVAGSGSSGMHVICVAMRMNSNQKELFETDIDAKGRFSIDVKLPGEGFWLMTYLVTAGEEVVEEGAFDAITYDDTLLPVRLDYKLPATTTLTGSSLTISGTTLAKTKVQCVVDGRYDKLITTNNTGNFSFTIDTSDEGIYNITLILQKKGYDDRRFRCAATRILTDEDRRQSIRDEAISPTYANLQKKMIDYRGRYFLYTLHIKEVSPTATGYITFAGKTKTKSGTYNEVMVIRTTEAPGWYAGDKVSMYLKCLGAYDVTDDNGTKSYPYFDLQWIE